MGKKQRKLFDDSSSDDDADEEIPQLVPIKESQKNSKPSADLVREEEDEESSHPYDEEDSDLEIAEVGEDDFEKEELEQFAQRGINNEDLIKQRLKELKANFYNRMESKKLIKKQGRVPFIEHMTIGKLLIH